MATTTKYLGYEVVEREVGAPTKRGPVRVLGYRCRNKRCPRERWHSNVTAAAECGANEKGLL